MFKDILLATALVMLCCGRVPAGPRPAEPPVAALSSDRDNPDLIARAATAEQLPVPFFSRLIWQESRFNPSAVSRAGAEGIAQFLPRTARWRGLRDPFQPAEALAASARWLRELWGEFGSLGLAAAAYNAGPERVRRWLHGDGTLPPETRSYVESVTGVSAVVWAQCASPHTEEVQDGCRARADLQPLPKAASSRSTTEHGSWGLQLVGGRSQVQALSEYRGLQSHFPQILGDRRPLMLARKLAGRGSAIWYQVRVAEATRERANDLCTRLKRAGGACVVLRN